MNDIRPALRSYLLADPTISNLVGGMRIHNVRLPQNQVAPSVVYLKVGEDGDYHLQGDSGLGLVRMQIDSWATHADAATELANAVYDRLSGAQGTFSSVEFRGAFVVSGRDDYDDTSKLYRVSRDYNIWYGIN